MPPVLAPVMTVGDEANAEDPGHACWGASTWTDEPLGQRGASGEGKTRGSTSEKAASASARDLALLEWFRACVIALFAGWIFCGGCRAGEERLITFKVRLRGRRWLWGGFLGTRVLEKEVEESDVEEEHPSICEAAALIRQRNGGIRTSCRCRVVCGCCCRCFSRRLCLVG